MNRETQHSCTANGAFNNVVLDILCSSQVDNYDFKKK